MKYHAQFLLDKEKDKPDAKVRYRIKWQGNIVAFTLGYRIDIDKWNKEVQRCKGNTTHGKKKVPASIINRKISHFEEACDNVFIFFQSKKVVPNAEEFRVAFNAEIGREKKQEFKESFFELFEEFKQEEGRLNQWSIATYKKIDSIKNHLYNFDADLQFNTFTEEKLNDYLFYLQNELQLKNSTILKNFSFVKWYLKWAKRKGYNNNLAYEEYKPKLKTTNNKIIFLTPSELNQFREFEVPNNKNYLKTVKDIFLFQCFTGLRYSDVQNLKKSDVKSNFIEVTTVKTTDSLIIELNTQSREILDKYKDYDYIKALPVISNQKMNDYLKELAELVGIDEPVRKTYYIGNKRYDKVTPKYALLSTHAGRRTFICNALSLGIPPQVVMKWTGHSDYKAMKPYIDIADEIKASAMKKFDSL